MRWSIKLAATWTESCADTWEFSTYVILGVACLWIWTGRKKNIHSANSIGSFGMATS